MAVELEEKPSPPLSQEAKKRKLDARKIKGDVEVQSKKQKKKNAKESTAGSTPKDKSKPGKKSKKDKKVAKDR